MKNNNYIFVLFLSLLTFATYAQVGIGTTAVSPDASAILDVTNANKGVLIPRVALSDVTNTTTPINSPVNSLIVYNTNTACTGGAGVGFYYFNGTQWVPFAGTPTTWSLYGNSNTTPATNYAGTSDAQDFVIKTNNTEAMRVNTVGDIGIGTSLPTTKLHISTASTAAVVFETGFELGTLAPFTTGGDKDWLIGPISDTGVAAAESPENLNNNESSWLEVVVTMPPGGGSVTFSYMVSTELNYDILSLYIDEISVFEASGIVPYTAVSIPFDEGVHTLRWEYSKDFNFNGGDDQVFVDTIRILENADPSIRIADGTEALNRVLVSDANGYGTWQDASSGFTDLDWIFNSGSQNWDPMYHTGPILINQSTYTTATQSDFYVNNGDGIGTRIGLGSIETILDSDNATLFSDAVVPLTDNTMSLGDATNRWDTVYLTLGYTTTSDRRVKTDIKTIEYGINQLMNLNPVSYKWKDVKTESGEFVKPVNEDGIIGFIAQDLNKVVPEVVHTYQWEKDKDNNPIKVPMKTLGVSYSDLIPVLIKSIQDQQKVLETIESEQKEIAKKINLK